MSAAFEIDIKSHDPHFVWRLSGPDGLVIDQGIEHDLSRCLVAATDLVQPAVPLTVYLDGVPGGSYFATRVRAETSAVADEVLHAFRLGP